MKTETWHRLFNAALNDQLSDAERGQLATVLKSSAEARQLWFLYQDNECSLAELKPRREAKTLRTGLAWFFWLPIAAAALVIGAFVFYAEISERLGHSAVVARFGQLDGCRWMDPATRVLSGDGIAVGQRVELSAGRAELHFATGARVTLLGPAIFELRSKNSGFLTLGEVSVAAETAESKGFVLATPTSDFVDIGTAFSAGVSADGLSRLEVSEEIGRAHV
jgi:hypothetical protein